MSIKTSARRGLSTVKRPRFFFAALLLMGVGLTSVGLGYRHFFSSRNLPPASPTYPVSKEKVAATLQVPLEHGQFPETVDLKGLDSFSRATVVYTVDRDAQNYVEKLFKTYRPDYGALVALDSVTGRLLSMASYTRERSELGNLALKAAFPAASIFKIVTAAAAIDQQKLGPESVIAFNGGYHTLYRRNVLENRENRWTRRITLREAFAHSVNTVFAKIGVQFLNPLHLVEYAKRFQFNQSISTDVPVEIGHFVVPEGESDDFTIAEMASGYNRVAVMSPLQGAMIAAAVANDGVMMEPFVVDHLEASGGEILYRGHAKPAAVTMSPESAKFVRELMRETVRSGTSRKAFRDLLRKKAFQYLDIGGKTGSLSGVFPKGKCDWFVGYASAGDRKIAIAALTVNEQNWRVKSSFLARSVMERLFTPLRDASFPPGSSTAVKSGSLGLRHQN